MYFTSFQCNRILFRWYTIKEWQRSFLMRQLQKVKVVKVKVEGWENLLNFQIDCEETTTNVKNCAGSSRIWLSPPPPRLPSPPHLWVPPITEAEASSSGQKILSSWLLLWVTPRPSLEGGATDTPHNLGVSGSRPSRAEVPPLVFGIIAKKKKVDFIVNPGFKTALSILPLNPRFKRERILFQNGRIAVYSRLC